ncbi:MAG: sugar ABC transporter permease [Hungatella hathewayi]|uniref:ABC transporter, permease protein n=2 Tax=Hungatella hathewayi TaxID=154046 RepID=D3AM13_9FIRM|nr:MULTISPECIES: sugar ABC transporter permease [Hungatella]EFC97149.1 ABC transporter, permease protein [Hungatella hathewayi DSM 13479]MDU4974326.1 sugar ABC transporter permease [Hungatella hathewayi]MDY6238349.1 sugar ABC transporter permease [Hungatella hathewayi]
MGLVYILPWLIGMVFLTLYPFINALIISFTDYNLVRDPNFIGLANYTKLFKDEDFLGTLTATLKYTVITVPLQLAFALFIAYILNFKLKGINFFRTAYYIPSLLGGNVAVAVLWRFLFQQDGLINRIIGVVGIQPVAWLSSPGGAMSVIIILKVWQFGSAMLIFLAALKDVPQDLYEAASVDGSTKLHSFIHITMPLITPTIFFNLVMQLVNAFQEFNGPYLVTGKGPLNATYLTSMYIYDNAFKYFNMGYASAASWILFLIIVAVTLILFATQDKWVYYSDGGN